MSARNNMNITIFTILMTFDSGIQYNIIHTSDKYTLFLDNINPCSIYHLFILNKQWLLGSSSIGYIKMNLKKV